MKHIARDFAERYAHSLVDELRHCMREGTPSAGAHTLIATILREWKEIVPKAGSTPESEIERTFWFALYQLEHWVDPDRVKLVDGRPAKDHPVFIEDRATGSRIAEECLVDRKSLPKGYNARRPPRW